MEGEDTAETQRDMILVHRKEVLWQIDELKKSLTIIDLKVAFYDSYKVGFHGEL